MFDSEMGKRGRLDTRTTHKDPFDRLVVWQAINRNVTLITKDKGIGAYRKLGPRTLWR